MKDIYMHNRIHHPLQCLITQAICLLLMFAGTAVQAQITVQLQPVLPTQLRLTDMWRGQVINSSAAEQTVYLKGSVSYGNSVTIVEGTSGMLVLRPGANLVSPATISVQGYQYNPAVNIPSLSSTEIFPFGAYILCLKVYAPSGTELGATCNEVSIQPLSPPLLISPYNQSEIPYALPLLTWTAPAPVPPGMRVQYDLKLVEILVSQTATDAIQRNYAMVDERNLSLTVFQYPATAMKLEKNKNYAWQITAKGDDFLIGTTEVWTFRLSDDTTNMSQLYMPDQFYKLKSQPDGGYGIAIETLGIAYEEAYMPGQMQVKVYDARHAVVNVKELKMDRVTGDNRFVVNLKETGKFKNGEFYTIEIKGAKGDMGVILFKYYSSRKKFDQENQGGKK